MKIKNEKKNRINKTFWHLARPYWNHITQKIFFTTVIKAFGKLDQLPIGDSHSRQDEFQPELLGFFSSVEAAIVDAAESV